ncbi:MAG: hypothetical protein Q4F05_03725 [bacterium]|nr:hypothetical protein [bacterium]
MKKKTWAVTLVIVVQTCVLTGCLSNDHSLDTLDSTAAVTTTKAPLPSTAPVTASVTPTAFPAAGEDNFATYRTKLFGTWENKKSKDTYTFDLVGGYSFAGKDMADVGNYSFATDSTGKMLILCLAGNQEIVNQYFKLTFDNDAQISVMNGKGEKETWVRR